MARTLAQILTSANAFLSLDASVPTGTDLTTWIDYANVAVNEAAATSQFREFDTTQITATSDGINSIASLASITLAANFREFTGSPKVDLGTGIFTEFPEIHPHDRFDKATTDKYCYVLGNPMQGYTAVFNQLTANATISMDFQRFPSGFATLTDICELPDDTYVSEKIKSYVLQARTDERFPTVEASANRKLQNMIGRESKTPGGGVNQTPMVNKRFRMGV